MGNITGTYIGDLLEPQTEPKGSDNPVSGDDNFRLLSDICSKSFPNVTGAVTVTHTQLNGTAFQITTFDSIDKLADVDTSSSAPSTGDRLKYDGSSWVPETPKLRGTGHWSVFNSVVTDRVRFTTEHIDTIPAALATVAHNDASEGWELEAVKACIVRVHFSWNLNMQHNGSNEDDFIQHFAIGVRDGASTTIPAAGATTAAYISFVAKMDTSGDEIDIPASGSLTAVCELAALEQMHVYWDDAQNDDTLAKVNNRWVVTCEVLEA